MKKVLQISNYYYPNIGGIEQVARDISNVIKDDPEYEVKVICFNEDSKDGEHVCYRKQTIHDWVDGVEIIKCGCFTKIASQSLSFSFGKELRRIMECYKPDVVVFHYPNPFQALYLLQCKHEDYKLMLYWHLDIIKQKWLRKLFLTQTQNLLRRADTIVATSPLYIAGSSHLSQFKSKCKVIPNSISSSRIVVTAEIEAKAEQIRQKNNGRIICFGVGRHIPYKGFTYLIKASQLLDDRFKIYIAGQGELTEELKAEAASDNKIQFLGRISDADLIAYYLAMDIFCFPSITKNEAFGIALAEGMYFGKPAVTFHIPGSGVNYVNLANVTGLECPNRDSHAYAEALNKLADDPQLRKQMGVAAKKRVVENFMEQSFRRNILQLLQGL